MNRENEPDGIKSPFDDLIIRLSEATKGFLGPGKETESEAASFLIRQLGLLRSAYINLVETTSRTIKQINERQKLGTVQLSLKEFALELPRNSFDVILNFFSFINILCQLNRLLPEHFSGAPSIPRYQWIRFYRNKAVEHWDEYTKPKLVGPTGYVFVENKASIPFIQQVNDFRERQSLMQQIKDIFIELGVKDFEWSKNATTKDKEYCDAVLEAIEKTGQMGCRAKDCSDDFKKLIEILFKLGFPNPITDIEVYSKELVDYLERLVGKDGPPADLAKNFS